MAAKILTPSARPICRHRMRADEVWSRRRVQTRIRPSEFSTQNQNFTEKLKLYQAMSFRAPESPSLNAAFSWEAKVMVFEPNKPRQMPMLQMSMHRAN